MIWAAAEGICSESECEGAPYKRDGIPRCVGEELKEVRVEQTICVRRRFVDLEKQIKEMGFSRQMHLQASYPVYVLCTEAVDLVQQAT